MATTAPRWLESAAPSQILRRSTLLRAKASGPASSTGSSLGGGAREWLSVAHIGSLLVNGSGEDLPHRMHTGLAMLLQQPVPAAVDVRPYLVASQCAFHTGEKWFFFQSHKFNGEGRLGTRCGLTLDSPWRKRLIYMLALVHSL